MPPIIHFALLLLAPYPQSVDEWGAYQSTMTFVSSSLNGGLPDVAGVPYTMTFFDENGTAIATLNASE